MKRTLVRLILAFAITSTLTYASEDATPPELSIISVLPLFNGETPILPSPTHLIRDSEGKLVSDDGRMGNVKVKGTLLRTYFYEYQMEMNAENPSPWAAFVKACLETNTLESLKQENPNVNSATVLSECSVWKITVGQWKKAIVLAIAIKREEIEEQV